MTTRDDAPTTLLVLGDLNADVVVCGDVVPRFVAMDQFVDDGCLTVGGSAAITAMGAARLGIPTSFVGSVGADLLGDIILDRLRARGIDVSGCVRTRAVGTGFSVILQPDDGSTRAILTYRGALASPLSYSHVAPRLTGARHLHVGGLFTQVGISDMAEAILAAARARNVTTSLDPNANAQGGWEEIWPLVSQCDVFLPNDVEWDEILAAGGAGDVAGSTLVAVKRGPRGATAIWGGATIRAGVPDVDFDLRDSVGAGDSFDAGLMCGLLEGRPISGALAMATACGTLSLRASGGVDGQATQSEAETARSQVSTTVDPIGTTLISWHPSWLEESQHTHGLVE